MKNLIRKTIELLKIKVKENLELINKNQTKLNEMLNQPFSSERTYMIERSYAANKALLSENNDLIGLQLSLTNFVEKYKESIKRWEEESEEQAEVDMFLYLDDDELFDLTIQGKLGFQIGHPKFDDEAFFNKLLDHYTSIEAYEKCNDMLRMKTKRQNV